MGALRWLNECGVLARLKTVSCVSGGSVIGAHLAHRLAGQWPTGPIPAKDWDEQIVEPFWRVVSHDIRTWPVLVRFICPWNWLRPHATVESLRKLYARHLLAGCDRPLKDVTGLPKFVFCSTDMVFNVNWEATWHRIGDYLAGYSEPPPDNWTMGPRRRGVPLVSLLFFPPAKDVPSAKRSEAGRLPGP